MRLPKDIIESGGMREHGLEVKIRWELRAGKDGEPQVLGRVEEGGTQVSSPFKDKEAFFVAEEATIGTYKVEV